MRHVRLGVLAGSLAAAICLTLTGCGVIDRDVEPLPTKRGPKGKPASKDGGPVGAKLDPVGRAEDYVGVIKGKVEWQDAMPDLGGLTRAFQGKMSTSQDQGYCLEDSAAAIE